ncbi:hypothetical protein L3Q82_022372 [Scortum barcoo]|uniref:Uncharacterized protein n=1 Tax=Scortum barcoo TaxID=214431 RepID=A0ACB8X1G3_9TELE|nr:hypothetical protein L3Q82_022372 [Scortum barcoo]
MPTPEPAQKKAWKWRNICTSLSHSALTGAGAVSCLYSKPQMVEDLISSHTLLSHSLVAASTGDHVTLSITLHQQTDNFICTLSLRSVSTPVISPPGYFIHDFLDVALNQPFKQSWEVLLHHSTVISCFTLAVTSRRYLGLAVVSLLIEINSVFLHIRQLLLLLGQRNRPGTEATAPRPSVAYSIASWLNLGTLLVFRVYTMGWMTRWLAAHSGRVPRYVLMMGTVGMSLISTMNAVLFYRLLRADIFTDTSKHQ